MLNRPVVVISTANTRVTPSRSRSMNRRGTVVERYSHCYSMALSLMKIDNNHILQRKDIQKQVMCR